MKKAKLLVAGLLAVAVASGVGMSDNLFKSSAAPDFKELTTLENTQQLAVGETIPDEYSFTPTMQYDKDGNQLTEVYTFGNWDYTKVDTVEDETMKPKKGTANITWIDEDSSVQEGRLGVYYQNIGTYNGRVVNMRVTYMGTLDHATKNGFALISYTDKIGIRTSLSPEKVILKYEFVDNITDENIEIKGYQQIEDIDMYQGINLSNYDKLYYSEAALDNLKVVNYDGIGDTIQSTLSEDVHSDPTGKAKIAFTFSGDSYTLTWTTSSNYFRNVEGKTVSIAKAYKDLDREQSIERALNTYYYVDADGNIVDKDTEGATRKTAVLTLGMTSDKFVGADPKADPAPDPTPNPTPNPNPNPNPVEAHPALTVTKTVGSDAYKPGDIVSYDVKIAQIVENATAEDVSLSDVLSSDIEDTVDANFVLDSIVVKDKNGNYMSEHTDYDVVCEGNNLLVKTTLDLNYNDYIEIIYNVKVADETKMTTLNNTAYALADNVNDLVKTTVPVSIAQEPIVQDKPALSVVKTADKDSYTIGDTANYTIKVTQTTANAIAENVVISDELTPDKANLVADSIKVFDKDGKAIEDATIEVKDNDFTVKTNKSLAADEFVTVTYSVELKDVVLANTSVENAVVASATDVENAKAVATVKVVAKQADAKNDNNKTDNKNNGTNKTNPTDNKSDAVQTGDRSPIIPFAVLGLISLVGIVGVVVYKKRK